MAASRSYPAALAGPLALLLAGSGLSGCMAAIPLAAGAAMATRERPVEAPNPSNAGDVGEALLAQSAAQAETLAQAKAAKAGDARQQALPGTTTEQEPNRIPGQKSLSAEAIATLMGQKNLRPNTASDGELQPSTDSEAGSENQAIPAAQGDADNTALFAIKRDRAIPEGRPLADRPLDALAEKQTSNQLAANNPAKALPAKDTPEAEPLAVFRQYVAQQLRLSPTAKKRQSALLQNPGQLLPKRKSCSIRPAAVLIDLDPQRLPLDPSQASSLVAHEGLGPILTTIRDTGTQIFWISDNNAVAAPAIRRLLQGSGLDSDGDDAILLMRRPEDRKQTRREQLGKTHCLIAIAGDSRGDFDELFLYLKDPASAGPLERLIGNGWFLIPQPLLEER